MVKRKHETCTAVICDGNGGWHILKRKLGRGIDETEAFLDECCAHCGTGREGIVGYWWTGDVVERAPLDLVPDVR